MVGDVLDYSSGYPSPASIKAAGYSGIVRYIGTPGRAKNMTRREAGAMRAAGIPIAGVYESTAGWMLGGASAGREAALRALDDAARLGLNLRSVNFACDVDITTAAQMTAVRRCLDGASATALNLARTGVYGEADVIDACVGGGNAVWGWQTRAWSGGRVSSRAHLLQQIGYVYPGGVQCDRSTVLKLDWGQSPAPTEETVMDAETREALADIRQAVSSVYQLLSVGDNPDPQGGDTHPNNVENVLKLVKALTALESTDAAQIVAKLSEVQQGQAALAADLRSLAAASGDPSAVGLALADTLERAHFVVQPVTS